MVLIHVCQGQHHRRVNVFENRRIQRVRATSDVPGLKKMLTKNVEIEMRHSF